MYLADKLTFYDILHEYFLEKYLNRELALSC